MSSVPNPPIRLVMRLLLEFMVGTMPELSRWHGGDLVRGIAFLAVAQANRPRFSELARAGILPWTRGDAALKPLSVLALAESLKLSYETTRRRVLALDREGLVLRLEQGVVVPNAVVAAEPFTFFADRTYGRFLAMLRGLRAIGFDFASFSKDATPDAGPPPPDGEPDLAARHVVIDFVLRLVECGLFAHENDLVRALIFSAVMSANAEPYTADPGAAWDYATLAQSPPESRRKPVSVAEVAQRTGIPYETARRYVVALLRDKDLARIPGKGLINPQVSPRDALLHRSGALVMSRFVQLVGDLGRLGFGFERLRIEARRTAA
ncbi:MAG TPA: hypothetical protein VGC36_14965 [Rhizomicrobium sp.]